MLFTQCITFQDAIIPKVVFGLTYPELYLSLAVLIIINCDKYIFLCTAQVIYFIKAE